MTDEHTAQPDRDTPWASRSPWAAPPRLSPAPGPPAEVEAEEPAAEPAPLSPAGPRSPWASSSESPPPVESPSLWARSLATHSLSDDWPPDEELPAEEAAPFDEQGPADAWAPAEPWTPAPAGPPDIEWPDMRTPVSAPPADDVPPADEAPIHPPRRRGLVAGALAVVLVAAGIVAYVVSRPGEPSLTTDLAQAVSAVAAAPGASVTLAFGDDRGNLVGAEFTVTADGLGSGTVTDPGGGRADVRTNGTRTVVRGDAAWWARRAPDQVSALADRWVQPKDGVALPVDAGRVLTPKGLAEAIRFAGAGRPAVAGTVRLGDRDADLVENGDWSLVATKAQPRTVVWFGGHLSGFGPLQPSSRLGGPPWLLPLPTGDGAGFVPAYERIHRPPYVSVTVAVPDEAALGRTRAAVGEVLAPDKAGSAAIQQAKVQVKAPRFQLDADLDICATPQCSWAVTVTNTGTAPGDATVVATVEPGMATRTIHLGVVAPGARIATPAMPFKNPAPGQNSEVRVRYSAQVYSPVLDGPSSAPRLRMQSLQLDPSRSSTVGRLDPSLQVLTLGAADVMTRGKARLTEQEQATVTAALEAAVTGRLLPELQVLVAAGQAGRLENPADLAGLLAATADVAEADRVGVRRTVELAATLLRDDPAVHLRLGRDLLDVTHQRAYRVAPVTGDALVAPLGEAANRLGGAPPGYARVAVLHGEPAGVAYLSDRSRPVLSGALCPGGRPALDELVVVNGAGRHVFGKEQFHDLDGSCP
ncbi:hypothetical protein GCM10010399_71860 [Dactylosporangium fulvum]|uniref:Uncharacterized protein n=1 Tax=Dactylosporangium fulvum TaxID=53359 RepID=A0ABY5W524_9ACTN|nr:hypothetical protein [Dactylosporangium fulvum]UWP85113.1 hypothetical protein Dfulv_13125 [Dactylosporangium fulvum]